MRKDNVFLLHDNYFKDGRSRNLTVRIKNAYNEFNCY